MMVRMRLLIHTHSRLQVGRQCNNINQTDSYNKFITFRILTHAVSILVNLSRRELMSALNKDECSWSPLLT